MRTGFKTRPLVWVQAAVFVVISAVLASPAMAQSTVDPGSSAGGAATTLPQVPRVDPPPAPPTPDVLQNVVWLEQADARDFARNYPDLAAQGDVSGRATIDCQVVADGRLDCVVTNEEPVGYGFGDATLAISRQFRVAPTTSDGRPTEGGRIRRTIRWVIG
ncbi:MAG: energy transducer TonB [Caulobacteraceae bacterium]|nr:energy transducer TonB [Caulobacteraceae bacterium]